MCQWGFSGGPVVETPPANTADMGSIPGLGRSHMPGGNQAHVPQLLSLHAATTETSAPRASNNRSHCNEKPTHCDEEQSLLATTSKSPSATMKTQYSQKLNK